MDFRTCLKLFAFAVVLAALVGSTQSVRLVKFKARDVGVAQRNENSQISKLKKIIKELLSENLTTQMCRVYCFRSSWTRKYIQKCRRLGIKFYTCRRCRRQYKCFKQSSLFHK